MAEHPSNLTNSILSSSDSEYLDGDSDDDPCPDAQFDDGYDESYLGDEDDRKRLEAMTDREREEVLFGRSQRREILLTEFSLRQKLLKKRPLKGDKDGLFGSSSDRLVQTLNFNIPADEKTKHQLGADEISTTCENALAETDEETNMEGSSPSKLKRHSQALGQLVAERKRKRQVGDHVNSSTLLNSEPTIESPDISSEPERETEYKIKHPFLELPVDKSAVSSDSDMDNEDDLIERHRAIRRISTLNELSNFRISRFKLASWCHTPFFRDVAIGSYVRIGIGPCNGQPVYRIAEIVDVCSVQKAYDFEDTKTDKVIKIRHGTSHRLFRMIYVSNQHFTEREFRRWKFVLEKQKQQLPTISEMESRASILKSYSNYVYQDDDIEYMLKEKRRLKLQPVNYAVRRVELRNKLDVAKTSRDVEAIEAVEKELANLDNERTFDADENSRTLEEINKRNRQITAENVEAALIQLAKESRNAGPDPFTRRRCLPSMVTKSRSALAEEPVDSSTVEHLLSERAGMRSSLDRKQDTKGALGSEGIDLFAIHDFDINIDFNHFDQQLGKNESEISEDKPCVMRKETLPQMSDGIIRPDNPCIESRDTTSDHQQGTPTFTKRLLNIEEYKQKRGFC